MDDTIFALRPGFDEKKHIRVRFLGEHAIVQPVGRFYVDIICVPGFSFSNIRDDRGVDLSELRPDVW